MTAVDISYLDKVKSTNNFSMNLIKKNISVKGIVVSDIQTNGRGRYGNSWISNAGNIFCSIYKKVKNHEDITNAQFNCLGIIVKFLKKVGVKKQLIKIKQPNDILIDNKKICGILVESIRYKKNLYLIVGIGLNLTSSPKIVNYGTTFLKKYLKKKIDKFDFVNFAKQNIKYF